MNSNEIPVYPNIKRIVNICKARIQIVEIKIFESVRIAVYLLDTNDSLVEATQFLFDGPEYAAWSNDDTYLVKLVKQKIQEKYI